MNINAFDFDLPRELIAQFPISPRDHSKLLYLKDNSIIDKQFREISDLLAPGDVLVFNDTKVIPALLHISHVNDNQKALKITMVKQLSDMSWQAMAKPAKKVAEGDIVTFKSSGHTILKALIITKRAEDNYLELKFLADTADTVLAFMLENGAMPLPPYIKRAQTKLKDYSDYQTVYSEKYGAVAAPTAGLHFTDELIQKLSLKGIEMAFITLHVGLGTFFPIKATNLEEHIMHSEKFTINQEACDIINGAKARGTKVICVGTTTLRVLESVAVNGCLAPKNGETAIFIKPGYKFQIATSLITNFHLPKSTLFVLIAAAIGLDVAKTVYAHAIEEQYRFFSYGDACYFSCISYSNP